MKEGDWQYSTEHRQPCLVIEEGNCIISIGGVWDEFADEKDGIKLSSKDVCGRPIWDFITADAKSRAADYRHSTAGGKITMSDNPYDRFSKTELILRDELAIDRTILANERTVLSYLRGSVALIIAGVTFVHFIEFGMLRYIGISLIPIGLVTGVFGVSRYRRMDQRIRAVREGMGRNPEKK